jgi:electron transport complex protein RnfG
MKKGVLFEDVRPTLALVVIALVVTAALAFTYGATKPVIDDIHESEANIAKRAVLPGAEDFQDVTAEVKDAIPIPETIVSVFEASGGQEGGAGNAAGYVVVIGESGFGGTVEVMVGIGGDGAVTGVKVLNHAETPGLGTKAMTDDYLAQYTEATDIKTDKLDTDRTEATEIDTITGATITSNTVYRAVNAALEFAKNNAESLGETDE